MPKSPKHLIPAAAIALLLAACAGVPAIEDAEDRADRSREAARTGAGSEATTVAEAWLSAMIPADNIDSPTAWTAPDGKVWVIATAKSTDQLLVYDGTTGKTLQRVGKPGKAEGEFDRPNGVAVVDDLLFVVERDNRRVQLMRLPGFTPLATFGAGELRQPYGLWVNRTDAGFDVYVTDAYMAGEDAAGEDILPPLAELDHRVHRYAVSAAADGYSTRHVAAFGDTTADGALRVVESVWGDPANDRLLVAEEDEAYANELKVYDLEGRFAGRTVGRDVFKAQAEGIALKACADGSGWWLTTEQGKGRTVFHLFDRATLAHVGAVAGKTVANTDGIWLHDVSSQRFPEGALYAVHDDQGVVALDWRDIAGTLSLHACPRK
ncbi:phytase [Luteimonas sp. 22616]|uniref:phytase n=1 Tax=Luteimonas sp. 22616 TaxID=3453951 RepID=UPI003F86ABA3